MRFRSVPETQTALALLRRRAGLPCSRIKTRWQGVGRLGVRRSSGLTRSISEGHRHVPLLGMTIPEHFDTIAGKFADHRAVTSVPAIRNVNKSLLGYEVHWNPRTLTYRELDSISNILAHSLRAQGVRKGDRVAVSLGNCWEFAALTYAVYKLGAILVPLNPQFNAEQVTAALNHLEVKLLIINAMTDLAYKPGQGRSNIPLLKTIVPDLTTGSIKSPTVKSLEKVVVVDNSKTHFPTPPKISEYPSLTPFDSIWLHDAKYIDPVIPDSPLSPSETINIQFTSGTTSHPKAAMLTHENILNNGHLIAQRMGLEPSDRIICPPPLFHCFGCILGYMACATTGAEIMFPSPAFDPAATIVMAHKEKATGLYGVATMFVSMFEELANPKHRQNYLRPIYENLQESNDEKKAFPLLKKGIAAGSSVPQSLMHKIYANFGLEDLVICYGMTETSPVSCMTTPDDPFEKRTSTVGRVMPHTTVKIVDPENRTRVLPIGERGELAAAGYLVMKGYWGDKERTDEVRITERDEDGKETVWMYSGDEASMDEEGYVAITGRIKDLIIRGGENIHPLEIENCLFQHEYVAEVSVVGVPCERHGESVGAFVIAHEGVGVEMEGMESDKDVGEDGKKVLTAEMVREWVRSRLSGHLVPKHVWFVKEYPKTASGKIQKFKLRELAKKWLREAEERQQQ
ncbi:hypothetical protein QBC41DRAFT_271018 [Cercophora samala]|uniref:Uncharacterized protein n=1 Tax=Cercophora samala TaxID=330535 RepID=A0AA39ZHN2_9PEZI|nr:hypothetical protein QBC41DRAFT_271018 [Cercophora samala]